MSTPDTSQAEWRKSSRSGGQGGDCVELAKLRRAEIGLRDSKNPSGGHLTIGPTSMRALLADVKSGRHDL